MNRPVACVAVAPAPSVPRALHRAHRSPAGGRRTRDSQGGAVTVELAVGLIGVVVLLGLVLLLTAAATAQLRCTEAARAGARAAALGQEDAAVADVARRAVGDSAHVEVVRAAGWVTVPVGRPVGGPWAVGPFDAHAQSSTPVVP